MTCGICPHASDTSSFLGLRTKTAGSLRCHSGLKQRHPVNPCNDKGQVFFNELSHCYDGMSYIGETNIPIPQTVLHMDTPKSPIVQ